MALFSLIHSKKNTMKKIVLSLFVAGILTSCSTCYECTHVVEIEQGGVVTEQEVTEDFCTALPDEIDQKEQEGYSCSAV
jgi:hypothetical protein